MKNTILFIFMMLTGFVINGQNLVENGSFEGSSCDICATLYEFESGCVDNWQNYHHNPSAFDSSDPNCTYLNGAFYYAPHQDHHALVDANDGIFQTGDFQPGTYSISFRYTRGEGIFENYPVYVNVGFANGLNNVSWDDSSNLSIPIENVVSQLVTVNDPVNWATYTGTFELTESFENIVIYGSSEMQMLKNPEDVTAMAQASSQAPTMRALIDNIVLECQDCCTPDEITITANGTDITNTLTTEIPCGENCITLNATNLENAVYNTTDPVLTDLNGLFCLPANSTLESFTATITGQDSCGNPYTENVLVTIEQDCCSGEISIEPFWSHPDCPEDVCTAEQWPIIATDENGDPITSAGGVSITWTNTDTNETLNQDWIYASVDETWVVTITYPDGCEYTATYFEDCCNDDIHIEAIICPEEEQIAEIEAELSRNKSRYRDSEYSKMMKALEQYRAVAKGECDPCDIGYVLIHLVDVNGNEIVDGPQYTITWSDNGSGVSRLIPVDTQISVIVTHDDGNHICTYEDSFIYECEDDCENLTAPTNLQVVGTTLTWDPVPGATSYIISSPAWNEPQIACKCTLTVSLAPQTVTTNSYSVPSSLHDDCFVWKVQAVCEDGTVSPASQACFHAVKLSEKEILERAVVSPNPNNGSMQFTLKANQNTPVMIEVYDFYGKLVQRFEEQLTEDVQKSINWNASGKLSQGIYIVTFKLETETIKTKVIIE